MSGDVQTQSAPLGSATAFGPAGLPAASILAYLLAKWAVPFVKAPTGSMANNGAITLGTALALTLSGGCWMWLPAGAVAAGVPAAASWLWVVMSSTTVGTVFNSTYTTGIPTLGVQTAFVTTGPGAFAGDTGEITGPIISVPANALGLNGELQTEIRSDANNTAGAKTIRLHWPLLASTASLSSASTTAPNSTATVVISARGVAANQLALSYVLNTAGAGTNTEVALAADLTAATLLNYTMQCAVATDWMILQSANVRIAA